MNNSNTNMCNYFVLPIFHCESDILVHFVRSIVNFEVEPKQYLYKMRVRCTEAVLLLILMLLVPAEMLSKPCLRLRATNLSVPLNV